MSGPAHDPIRALAERMRDATAKSLLESAQRYALAGVLEAVYHAIETAQAPECDPFTGFGLLAAPQTYLDLGGGR